MKRYINYARGIVINPRLTFQKVLQERPMKFVFIIMLIYGILAGLVLFFNVPDLSKDPFPGLQKKIFLAFPIIYLMLWFISSGLLRVSGRQLKGKGTFKDMLFVFGMTHMFLLLISPFAFLLFMIMHIGSPISTIWRILISIWLITILIIGIKQAHQFSIAKAIGSLILAFVYLIGIFLLIFFFRALFWSFNI